MSPGNSGGPVYVTEHVCDKYGNNNKIYYKVYIIINTIKNNLNPKNII